MTQLEVGRVGPQATAEERAAESIHPKNEFRDDPSGAEIHAALARIVASDMFRMSPQLAAFLRFVVEATLRGEGGRIKGYTIAVEALGRGEDFDPQTDPIVRVEAGRLRRALQQYYAGLGATDLVAVDLPPHRTPIQRAVYAGDLVTAFGRRCGATMEAMHDDAGPDLQSIANMGSERESGTPAGCSGRSCTAARRSPFDAPTGSNRNRNHVGERQKVHQSCNAENPLVVIEVAAHAIPQSAILHFSNTDVGLASSAYLAGAVLGAIFFGWLTDRLGRKKLFFVTLSVYLVATAATACSWNLASFALFRFLTGAGIGGEYTAINSAIQELIPKQYRGRTDLAINGSFWIGAAIGAAGSIVLLDPAIIDPEVGWRTAFLIGAVLALTVFFMRLWIPESPRWLITHGRAAKAEEILAGIERKFARRSHAVVPHDLPRIRLRGRRFTPLREVAHTLFYVHRQRALVGLSLMAAQAFFYNAIFFTYALILTDFFGIAADHVGWYLLPFAAGNFFGPLLLGPLFDTIGRKAMIAFTYAISGVLLAASGYLFMIGATSAITQTIAWMVIFFFASAAASSAYLTVSETFPLEIRALAIALFFATGTGIGGIVGPLLFGALIETGSRASVFGGYLLGAILMIAAATVQLCFGVAAERKGLEEVARPLAFVE